MKPVTVTATNFGYLANNAFFKVQKDTKGRFVNSYVSSSDMLRQEMNGAANATRGSKTNISSPLMAMVNWCGVRVLIVSVIPGAPWSTQYINAQLQYSECINNDKVPKEIPYKWTIHHYSQSTNLLFCFNICYV